MPLLRSRREVQRATLRAFVRFYVAMALLTVAFAIVVAEHYWLGWW